MISVLVLGSSTAAGRRPTSSDSVRTLAALVPGAVDGLVRDVVLVATTADAELAKVADYAGCSFVAEPDFARSLQVGAARARSEQILILLAGVSFDRALIDEMAGLASRHSGWLEGGVGVKSVETGWFGRIMPSLVPTVGLVVLRKHLTGVSADSFQALQRQVRPRRTFKTRAWAGGD
ncbi:hypothetical protein [Lichenifustis flavocetrariae]|uniref:Glycosyl transferase n=1 Tax=Lichenifustis flavocetrariae TaxID=2949735 RepID=A0AA42CLA7_9HYPH|nr:hypothetical protein [Lichenifustis flavocetrariae]MCW6510201.1 hypothetical protein [Lichenifustis flavocetrariae]